MSTATDLEALAFDATTERLIANARQTALLDAARGETYLAFTR